MAGKHYPALNFWRARPSDRNIYIYEFADGQKLTIVPGQNGVTEIDVKTLHKLDDHEVYLNIKSSRPRLTADEKEKMKQWCREHPGERPQKNWTVSLDAMVSGEDEADDAAAGFMKQAEYRAAMALEDDNTPAARMRELVDGMSPKRQAVYQLAMLDGIPNSRVAVMLGVSEGTIRYDIQAIRQVFRDDPILRSFMHECVNAGD